MNNQISANRLGFMQVRAGIKPAPTSEHGAFRNSPVGATHRHPRFAGSNPVNAGCFVFALPHNENFNFLQKNRMGDFLVVAQVVRQNRKPVNNVCLNQMVATLLAERSAKARVNHMALPVVSYRDNESWRK
jgi:hypothetical protein